MQLRPYQNDIIAQARDLMREGVKSILIVAPTGSGKTALTASMLKTAASRGMSSWFIVHRRELIMQSSRAFNKIGLHHGVISSGFDFRPSLTQICSIQTLVRRYESLPKPKLIVYDECHHLGASSWDHIYNQFSDAFHIGLTATPMRLDGKGLSKYFGRMVLGPSVSALIDGGYLSPYKLYAPQSIDLSSVGKSMGDYKKSDLTTVMEKPQIVGDILEHYRKYCDGKRTIIFCHSIEFSKRIVSLFRENGIEAAHIDGGGDSGFRDSTIERFSRGEIKVLSNVDLFGEGFDLPAIECVIQARPTMSTSLHLQQVGRSLRTYDGKTHAVIVDTVGNWERHGLPDDDRDWVLTDDKITFSKSTKSDEQSVRVCKNCLAAQKSGPPMCQFCGYTFPVKKRKLEATDGDLVEIDPKVARRSRVVEQARSETFEDLVQLAKKRGYKRPFLWAKHVHNGRLRGKK